MSTYIYREGCGWESDPFEAAGDDAAQAHAERTWRSPENPDFDGDSARLVIIETDEDGEQFEKGVVSWDGNTDPVAEQLRLR